MPAPRQPADVRIVDVPETPVACLPHIGPPDRIGETIRRFIAWRRAHGLSPSQHATWNILHDDPETTPPEHFRIDLCVSCDAVPANDAGIVAASLPGGRCAVLRHTGSDALLGDAIRFLRGDWLTASEEEPRDAPLFLRRVAFFPDVREGEAVTDIYLPLAQRPAEGEPQ
jgi:AraC family transcriptional regulator